MAIEYSGFDITLEAGADLRLYQYKYVVQSGNTAILATAGTDMPVGILQNAPNLGQAAVIRIKGTSKVVANGALAVGDEVIMEYVDVGDCGKAAPDAAANDLIVGIVVVASGGEDDVAGVKLVQYRRHAT